MHKYEHKKSAPESTKSPKRAAIIGARGYSGLELARILLQHPGAELVACFAGEQSFSLEEFLPEAAAANVPILSMDALESQSKNLDFLFLATPAETSFEIARKVHAYAPNVKVIDLSGAFRLDATGAKAHYGLELGDSKAHYGLSPFNEIASNLTANPGCFATSILMALIPLLREGVVRSENIVIDSKSGATGAGKKAAERLLFTEVADECLPYRIGKHQHLPEIIRWAKAFSGKEINPFFTTHLLPIRRGIISGLYLELQSGKTVEHVHAAYEKAFAHYPLVKFGSSENLLKLKKVCGSGRTHIQFQAVGNKLYVFSLIDNLLKGAASQAVENFNLQSGYPVETGLFQLEGIL